MGLCYLMASYKGLPNVLVLLFVLIAAYAFMTSQTVIGRRIYAMGGNVKAAMLSGVNTTRLLFYTFVNMGVLAALAGLIVAARLNSSTPNAGDGMELDVIAACFIGGASPTAVSVKSSAVVGAFLIGVLNNGMSIMGSGRLAEGCQRRRVVVQFYLTYTTRTRVHSILGFFRCKIFDVVERDATFGILPNL
jgi:putative multiple sugar transport system permease protein